MFLLIFFLFRLVNLTLSGSNATDLTRLTCKDKLYESEKNPTIYHGLTGLIRFETNRDEKKKKIKKKS